MMDFEQSPHRARDEHSTGTNQLSLGFGFILSAWRSAGRGTSKHGISILDLCPTQVQNAITMSTPTTELKRLAHSEYWDERYARAGPDKQVHEWFRSFNDLMPLFDRHLSKYGEWRQH